MFRTYSRRLLTAPTRCIAFVTGPAHCLVFPSRCGALRVVATQKKGRVAGDKGATSLYALRWRFCSKARGRCAATAAGCCGAVLFKGLAGALIDVEPRLPRSSRVGYIHVRLRWQGEDGRKGRCLVTHAVDCGVRVSADAVGGRSWFHIYALRRSDSGAGPVGD